MQGIGFPIRQPNPPATPARRPPARPQFKAALGGQCQAIISGGAPLATHVQEFVQVAMSCPVIQVCPAKKK
jgi:hypothetical protein